MKSGTVLPCAAVENRTTSRSVTAAMSRDDGAGS
jgi:hypothetical protein